jgi:predicted nucleic acid-binding protein
MALVFSQLTTGDSVFLDANTLIFHFGLHPTFGAACNQLLDRIEQQGLVGYTSTHVLSEMAHRLMLIEASALPGWTPSKIKLRLRQQPAAFAALTQFRTAVDAVLQSRIVVLSIVPLLVAGAAVVSQQHGLLSNDALIVAAMRSQGLTNLASADADFDRVPGIKRYAPA